MPHQQIYYNVWEGNTTDGNVGQVYYSQKQKQIIKSSFALNGPDPQDDDEAGEKKHAHHYLKRRSTVDKTRRSLSGVAPDDVLLIEGHGGIGVGYISNTIQGGLKLSAYTLSRMVEKDGLPKTHKYIRLLACHSAAQKNVTGKIAKGATADATCFAALLAVCLGKRGYNNIAVCGYTEKLVLSSGGVNDKNKNKVGGKLWFDHNGHPIEKPPREIEP